MGKIMKILMLSSEAIPYAKAGGLADVVPTLARELALLGHDVRILLPRYYSIDPAKLQALPVHFQVPIRDRLVPARIKTAILPQSTVPVYFLENENYFGRDGIYGTIDGDFPDNCERFAFLNQSAFGLCRALSWIPDLIHAHDWPSAPSLACLGTTEILGDFADCAGVFTIHNVGYQGLFPAEQYSSLGIPWSEFKMGSFEFFGRVNFMQAALRHAQKITTVSPTYAKEIMSPQLGFGMEGILQERHADVEGILNGMDYTEWNPQNDRHLPAGFEWDRMEGKALCKRALQEACGFDLDPNIPVFGIISRLVSQKGFVELAKPGTGSLTRILADFPLQLVILGTGERWCEEELQRLADLNPKLKLFRAYSEQLSHLIQAGSDFFLMPSLYEPCGLTQLYALRYGSIPVVAPTGGLADTVSDLRGAPQKATGVYIPLPVSPESIYQSIRMALHLWLDRKSTLVEMQVRGMKQRFTWEASSKRYETLYQEAIKIKRQLKH